MTEYSLQNVSSVVGTFTVKLFSEFAGLTVPTFDCFLEVGDLDEVVDIKAGITEAARLRVTLRDDYTNYTYGFWFKVLSGDCRVRFYLDQGSGNTFYFFGTPQADTIRWSERYINSTTRVRTVSFDLVDLRATLFDTPTTDWVDDVVAGATDTGYAVASNPSWLIKPTRLFDAMLSASGLNSSYSTDTSFVYDGTNIDLQWMQSGIPYRLDQVYCPVMYYNGAGHVATDYFSHSTTAGRLGLDYHYPKLHELLGDLLRNFGVFMRMSYDTATERHKIELVQKARAYSGVLDFGGREKVSSITKSFDLYGDAVVCRDLDSTLFTPTICWFSKKYAVGARVDSIPNFVTFDVDTNNIWKLMGTVSLSFPYADRNLYYWDGVSGHAPAYIDAVKYYDYATSTLITASTTGNASKFQEAIAGYIFGRFSSTYSRITRRYSWAGMDSTTLNVGRRTNIDDGLSGSVPYYANSVKKTTEDELEIDWIKETP